MKIYVFICLSKPREESPKGRGGAAAEPRGREAKKPRGRRATGRQAQFAQATPGQSGPCVTLGSCSLFEVNFLNVFIPPCPTPFPGSVSPEYLSIYLSI